MSIIDPIKKNWTNIKNYTLHKPKDNNFKGYGKENISETLQKLLTLN